MSNGEVQRITLPPVHPEVARVLAQLAEADGWTKIANELRAALQTKPDQGEGQWPWEDVFSDEDFAEFDREHAPFNPDDWDPDALAFRNKMIAANETRRELHCTTEGRERWRAKAEAPTQHPHLSISDEDRERLRNLASAIQLGIDVGNLNEVCAEHVGFLRRLADSPVGDVGKLADALAWAIDWIECEGKPDGFDAASEPENWNEYFDARAALHSFKAAEGEAGTDG